MTKINVDINPRGMASAYINAPFDTGKKELEKQGYKIISLEENAKLRMQEGKDAFISRNGNWVKEGVIYVPNEGRFLTKVSPIMESPKKATNCHRNGQDYYLTDKQVERALEDSVLISDKPIPTNRFADNKITAYAFGDSAKQYGEFLREAGIKEMPIWLANIESTPFVRQLWFNFLGYGSELVGYDRYLCCGYGVRGVCKSAEGTAKNFEAYTPIQLEKALNKLGFSGVAKGLVEKLRNQ